MKPHALAVVAFAAVLLLASAWGDGGRLGAIAAPAQAQETGGKIAFVSDRDGNDEIYVMNADGSGQTNLTNNPAGDFGPDWSPDGSRIAFQSGRDGSGEIYVMNADGSGQTHLTGGSDPAWSPDGSRIAFISGRDGNSDIFVMNADGSGQTNLTETSAGDLGAFDLDWSPDGSRIAFTSRRDHPVTLVSVVSLYVMNADGSGLTDLTGTQTSDVIIAGPAWSPDGSSIAIHSFLSPFGNLGFHSPAIGVESADGSGSLPELIGQSIEASAPPDSYPTWSPDGSRIAFQSGRDDPNLPDCLPLECNSEIYVMNADGSDPTNLTNNPASDTFPAWSPQAIAEPTPTPASVELTPEPVEPTPTPIAAMGDGDGAPVGAIVGGVVGGVLLLAVGGGVGFWFLRIRKT